MFQVWKEQLNPSTGCCIIENLSPSELRLTARKKNEQLSTISETEHNKTQKWSGEETDEHTRQLANTKLDLGELNRIHSTSVSE